MRCHYTPTGTVKYKNLTIPIADKGTEQQECSFIDWRNTVSGAGIVRLCGPFTVEDGWKFPYIGKHGLTSLTLWSSNHAPGYLINSFVNLCAQKTRKQFFIDLELETREGNGIPLQYSCLEHPIDGGAWWATVHGVAKSRTRLSDFTFTHWRKKWQPTPVFLPGESQGWGSLVGCRLWGHTESDMTEAT